MAADRHSAPKKSKRRAATRQGSSAVYIPSDARRSKRKKSRKTPVIVVVLVVIVIAAAAAGWYLVGGGADHKGTVRQGQEITVEIASGSSTTQIADLLVDNGVIESRDGFTKRVKELGEGASLQAGNYTFTGGEDIDDIIDRIANGKVKTVTIPEGYTIKQISQTVADACGLDADEFFRTASTGASGYVSDYPVLANCYGGSLEGFLYPSTYNVKSDVSVDSLIRDMLAQYQQQISSVDMSYAKSKNLTEYDVVTLASMIEKESRTDSDKADISAVFYNRLHADMALGSDVTTYYAVGKDMTEELTASDLASTSPYNTRNPNSRGLPAGPICSPSLASLKAAANPSSASYLYFFYSESANQVYFFNTQQEFDAAWAKEGKQ